MAAFAFADGVQVTTTTSGTGPITLASAVSPYQTFAAGGITNGQTVMYRLENGTAWEEGIGVYSTAGPTLTRTLVQSSTGSLLNLSGTSVVTVTVHASWFKSPTVDSLTLNNGQVAFPATQVPSAGANTLDDYEKGTWTPGIGGTTTNGTYTYTNQIGTYEKIGRLVIARFQIDISATTTASTGSQLSLIGLPFTINGSDAGGPITLMSGITLSAGMTMLSVQGRTATGVTTASFLQFGSGVTGSNLAPGAAAAAFALRGTLIYYS